MSNPLAQDLDHVLDHTRDLWNEVRDQRIFITGGTGFIGCWLLESFAWANDRLRLKAEAFVLTRNKKAFSKHSPHLAEHPAIQFHEGDVRSFNFPSGDFTSVIHAALGDNPRGTEEDSFIAQLDILIQGTCHTLEFAAQGGASKFLLVSTGATYGTQPSTISHITEEYVGTFDPLNSKQAYSEVRRFMELLCILYAEKGNLDMKIARCFTFVGPYLPLESTFAVGNFIQDGMQGGPIKVKGDGTPCRSYLYAADLAIWLWTILFKAGSCRPYNVGSEASLTIAELARKVSHHFASHPEVQIVGEPTSSRIERYVPSTLRARTELGLNQYLELDEALRRTVQWCSRNLETLDHPSSFDEEENPTRDD